MIAKIKRYFQESQQRYRMLKEGRAILKALNDPAATSSLRVLTMMMRIGLASLRVAKANMDATKAAREMERRIQEGPRPSRDEARLN